MENHVHFDWKISHFERKIIYALILPSNNFRKPHLKRESSSTLFTRSKTHLQAYLNQAPASPTQPSFDQPRSCCPTIQNPSPSIPLNHFQRKKGTEPRERERGRSPLESERESPIVREREREASHLNLRSTPPLSGPCLSPPIYPISLFLPLPPMSSIYPFLSTHVEQTTARRATHRDLVASVVRSCLRHL